MEDTDVELISFVCLLVWGLALIFLGPGQWHGGGAEDEVWLPEIGVDKVCPTSFSAENLELVPFLFLMLGNRERADCMCMAPQFPGMSCGLSVFGCFLEPESEYTVPFGQRHGGAGLDSVCGTVGPFYVFTRPSQFSFPLPTCPQAACALCEMLSGSLCQEAVQELYPRLLLAVLRHLYWVIEQNAPQKMVVYKKEGGSGNKSKTFDPTR